LTHPIANPSVTLARETAPRQVAIAKLGYQTRLIPLTEPSPKMRPLWSNPFAALIAVGHLISTAHAQTAPTDVLRANVRSYTSAHDVAITRELSEFLAIPNLASDAANIQRKADHLIGLMRARGITARTLQSPSGGPPAVYGELESPGATRTVVFYAHFD